MIGGECRKVRCDVGAENRDLLFEMLHVAKHAAHPAVPVFALLQLIGHASPDIQRRERHVDGRVLRQAGQRRGMAEVQSPAFDVAAQGSLLPFQPFERVLGGMALAFKRPALRPAVGDFTEASVEGSGQRRRRQGDGGEADRIGKRRQRRLQRLFLQVQRFEFVLCAIEGRSQARQAFHRPAPFDHPLGGRRGDGGGMKQVLELGDGIGCGYVRFLQHLIGTGKRLLQCPLPQHKLRMPRDALGIGQHGIRKPIGLRDGGP